MKTPNEIKKGLECCIESTCEPYCPYGNATNCNFAIHLLEDAIDYIRQIEAERDAAVKDIMTMSKGFRCYVCRKYFKNGGDCTGGLYCVPLRFEWRGVQKEE